MYLYRPKSTSLEVEIERSIYQNESVSSTSFNIKKKVEEKKKDLYSHSGRSSECSNSSLRRRKKKKKLFRLSAFFPFQGCVGPPSLLCDFPQLFNDILAVDGASGAVRQALGLLYDSQTIRPRRVARYNGGWAAPYAAPAKPEERAKAEATQASQQQQKKRWERRRRKTNNKKKKEAPRHFPPSFSTRKRRRSCSEAESWIIGRKWKVRM